MALGQVMITIINIIIKTAKMANSNEPDMDLITLSYPLQAPNPKRIHLLLEASVDKASSTLCDSTEIINKGASVFVPRTCKVTKERNLYIVNQCKNDSNNYKCYMNLEYLVLDNDGT